ncbi:MAG: hypothetical protein U0893_19675 [Chloroflexota bacterium]
MTDFDSVDRLATEAHLDQVDARIQEAASEVELLLRSELMKIERLTASDPRSWSAAQRRDAILYLRGLATLIRAERI